MSAQQLEMFEGTPDFYDWWLVFPRWENEDRAAQRFKERFGRYPEFLADHNRQLWVGPVREK